MSGLHPDVFSIYQGLPDKIRSGVGLHFLSLRANKTMDIGEAMYQSLITLGVMKERMPTDDGAQEYEEIMAMQDILNE